MVYNGQTVPGTGANSTAKCTKGYTAGTGAHFGPWIVFLNILPCPASLMGSIMNTVQNTVEYTFKQTNKKTHVDAHFTWMGWDMLLVVSPLL